MLLKLLQRYCKNKCIGIVLGEGQGQVNYGHGMEIKHEYRGRVVICRGDTFYSRLFGTHTSIMTFIFDFACGKGKVRSSYPNF